MKISSQDIATLELMADYTDERLTDLGIMEDDKLFLARMNELVERARTEYLDIRGTVE